MRKYLFCCGLFSTLLYAGIDKDFQYKHQPIDALCFFNIDSKQKIINLKQCGIKKEKYHVIGENQTLIAKGFIGYNWRNPKVSGLSQGQSYYQYLKVLNQHWLYTINNDGGSGDFTALYRVRRHSVDTLNIEAVAVGDRCNGGLQDVDIKNNKLIYSMHLTPYNLITLFQKDYINVRPYKDLADCAICCVAKANYHINAHENPRFFSITLNPLNNKKELPQQGKLASCFNDLFMHYTKEGKTTLSKEIGITFVNDFKKQCLYLKSFRDTTGKKPQKTRK